MRLKQNVQNDKQEIHTSYVDDIIRLTKNSNEIIKLKSTFEKKK